MNRLNMLDGRGTVCFVCSFRVFTPLHGLVHVHVHVMLYMHNAQHVRLYYLRNAKKMSLGYGYLSLSLRLAQLLM